MYGKDFTPEAYKDTGRFGEYSGEMSEEDLRRMVLQQMASGQAQGQPPAKQRMKVPPPSSMHRLALMKERMRGAPAPNPEARNRALMGAPARRGSM